MSVGAAPNISGGLVVNMVGQSASLSPNSVPGFGNGGPSDDSSDSSNSSASGSSSASDGGGPCCDGSSCGDGSGGPPGANPKQPPVSGHLQIVMCNDPNVPGWISGIHVRSLELGTTQTSDCVGIPFYYEQSLPQFSPSYTTEGGSATNCSDTHNYTYAASGGSSNQSMITIIIPHG